MSQNSRRKLAAAGQISGGYQHVPADDMPPVRPVELDEAGQKVKFNGQVATLNEWDRLYAEWLAAEAEEETAMVDPADLSDERLHALVARSTSLARQILAQPAPSRDRIGKKVRVLRFHLGSTPGEWRDERLLLGLTTLEMDLAKWVRGDIG